MCTSLIFQGKTSERSLRGGSPRVKDSGWLARPSGCRSNLGSEGRLFVNEKDSRHGSVTVNQYEREPPAGGMKETDPVIQLMLLEE